ncbi:MAG: hypothetical protein PUB21_01160 [Bacteroidales bacterium]|nr:hypothetical protein [Bacteroidales bacterium]
MKIKSIILILFLSLLAVGLFYTGYRTLFRLQEKKIQYDIDLYTLIPPDCKAIFNIHEAHEFLSDSLLKCVAPAFWDTSLDPLIVNDILLSVHNEGCVFYKKMFPEEIDSFLNYMKSDFKAENIKEKDIDIHIITTKDNRFFCYIYHQGVWIGSYRKRLIDRVIENWTISPLKQDTAFNEALQGLGNVTIANIILNKDSILSSFQGCQPFDSALSIPKWVGCDLSKSDGNLWITGILSNDTRCDSSIHTFIEPDFFPSNCFLIHAPFNREYYNVCFSSVDSSLQGGKVSIMPIKNHEQYNQNLQSGFESKEVSIYQDYAIFADSIDVINTFITLLKNDSLEKETSLLLSYPALSDDTKECLFAVDFEYMLADSTYDTFCIPQLIRERSECFSPYNIFFYTYNEEQSKRFFHLILSPKKR